MNVDFFAAPTDQPKLITQVSDADMDPSLVEPMAAIVRRGEDDPEASILPPPPPVPEWMDVADHVVDADRGLIVRIHRGRDTPSDAPLPCLFTIHGGGYIMGERFMDDPTLARLCPKLGIVGASVEYRLAPGCPYPGPLEDCYDGLAWVFANGAGLGIDTTNVGIYGASAGGGLAAALALLVRDRAEFSIRFQTLLFPMIDDRQITPSSQLDGLAVWPREVNEYGWRSYLGDLYGRQDLPYYAAAARARDLSGLPPAYIGVGGIDGFRDENIDYAMRLWQAGVPTELHVYPGGPHGFGLVPDAPISKQSVADTTDWLRRQFAAVTPGSGFIA